MRSQFDKPMTVLLRYPITFGGFLLLMSAGFYYREYFLGDIEEKRSKIMRQDDESNSVLTEFIKEYRLKNMKP